MKNLAASQPLSARLYEKLTFYSFGPHKASVSSDLLLQKLKPKQQIPTTDEKWVSIGDCSGAYQLNIKDPHCKRLRETLLMVREELFSKFEGKLLRGAGKRAVPHMSMQKTYRFGKFSNHLFTFKLFGRNDRFANSSLRIYCNSKGDITNANIAFFSQGGKFIKYCKLGETLIRAIKAMIPTFDYQHILQTIERGASLIKQKIKSTAYTMKSVLTNAIDSSYDRHTPKLQDQQNNGSLGEAEPLCRGGP